MKKDMSEIVEEIFSGFCRASNQIRIATCEYERTLKNVRLLHVDCNYEKCIHRGSCEIIRQALAREKEI